MATHEDFFAAVPLRARGEVEVRDPADQRRVVGTVPHLAADVIDDVVRAADAAQPAWAAEHPRQRLARILDALATLDADGLDRTLTGEQGKALADSQREISFLGAPVQALEQHVDWLADGTELTSTDRYTSRVYRDPHRVVGILTPWNVPISMAAVTIAPALVAGNSVVAHVPITTPLAVTRVFRHVAAALPDGVLSLVSSPDTALAQALVEHPLVRHVHFTGSTGVGRIVAAESAETLTETTLELGGNDAAILLDDIDNDPEAIQRLVAAAFNFAGQACNAIKRLYVPRARVEEVVDRLGSVLDRAVVGPGLDPETTMGPLHTAAGRKHVERLIGEAEQRGGLIKAFGDLRGDPEHGHFLRPSLVWAVDDDAAVVREEQFGPVLPVLGYDTVEEAIARANQSEYGLGGSVWAQDPAQAASVVRKLEVGMSWVNAHGGLALDPQVPWGGTKHSGVGRGGANRAGLEAFTEAHAVTIYHRPS